MFYSLRKFHLEDWSFEQKWVGILLPLLLAFDNPMFAYTLFTSNPLPGAIDAIGQVRDMQENHTCIIIGIKPRLTQVHAE